MSKLNIDLVWFQTTAGHAGIHDLYKFTLLNLKNNIDLNIFNNRFFSLKIFNNDDANDIVNCFPEFKHFLWHKPDARIDNNSPINDYSYYLLTNYLHDIYRVYLNIANLPHSKYIYLIEDDSPEIINSNSLEYFLSKSIERLEADKDLFSVHFRREGELKENRNLSVWNNELYIEDIYEYNFQNQIFRTDEMIKAAMIIKDNYEQLYKIHTETAARLAIQSVNPSYRFGMFNPKYCHSIHTGNIDGYKFIKSYSI